MIKLTMVRKSLNSLAVKLIIAIGAIMTLGSMIFGYLFIRYEEHIMMSSLLRHASSTVDLVQRSTYLGMLTAHQKAIEQTLGVIGSESEIKSILIYDKKGKVVYSSKESDVGRLVEKSSGTCRI